MMTESGATATKQDPQQTMGDNQCGSYCTAHAIERKRHDLSNCRLILKKGLFLANQHHNHIAESGKPI